MFSTEGIGRTAQANNKKPMNLVENNGKPLDDNCFKDIEFVSTVIISWEHLLIIFSLNDFADTREMIIVLERFRQTILHYNHLIVRDDDTTRLTTR